MNKTLKTCPQCGERYAQDTGLRFCIRCGTTLSVAEPVPDFGRDARTIAGVGAVGLIALISLPWLFAGSGTPSTGGLSNGRGRETTATGPSSTIATTSSTPDALSSATATAISENANLRTTNSASAGVVKVVPGQARVEVVRQQGAWFLVRHGGATGWMHGNTLRLAAAPSTATTYSASTAADTGYVRTGPGYDPNAPVLPRHKGDIEPPYNEVQRLKEQNGMSDAEAVNKILRDMGEIP